MNIEQAAQVMRVIEHAWPRKIEPETAALYIEHMRDLPYEVTVAAVKRLVVSDEFMPSIATIRRTVADALGLLPPPDAIAIAQADAWLDYQHQQGFVNGSGYAPEPPDVHPAVIAACEGVRDALHPSWSTAFRHLYRAQAEETRTRVLASNIGETVRALGSGS